MEIHQCFISPLAFDKNEGIVQELKEHILNNEPKKDTLIAKSIKHNLKESSFDFFNSNDIAVTTAVNYFTQCLKETVNQQMQENFNYEIAYVDSWFHIGEKYSTHEVHKHPNCSWCGIFYVDPGDINEGGSTIFMNPINMNFKDISNNFMDASIEVVPEVGKLVLFPSYLQHYQSLYTGDKKRIVMGFNIKILDRV
tara:strand:+ start:28 stop:615 length:588 start_codon:yes stop_codon:yes gene_type:complete